MARMKQLAVDIAESEETAADTEYYFPNHPVIPIYPATFCNGIDENAEVSSD